MAGTANDGFVLDRLLSDRQAVVSALAQDAKVFLDAEELSSVLQTYATLSWEPRGSDVPVQHRGQPGVIFLASVLFET